MTISVMCACGKEYRLGDDKAGRRFDCRECGTEVRVPRPEVEATRVPDLNGAEEIDEVSPVLFVPASRRRSKRKRSRSENDNVDAEPSSSWIPSQKTLLFGSLIVGAVLTTVAVCWFTNNLAMLWKFVAYKLAILTTIGGPVLLDQYNRRVIRDEIESYGGTINRIQWKPFQGSFFSTGWTHSRQARFYQVTYTDRDGQRRSGLCTVSPWSGTSWDDDIDRSSGLDSSESLVELYVIKVFPLLFLFACWFVSYEAIYSIWGEMTTGTITKVHRYEISHHSSGRGSTSYRRETRLDVYYTYKAKDGTEQKGSSNMALSLSVLLDDPRERGIVNVQYIPGNYGWSRLCSSPHPTSPLYYVGLLVALFIAPLILVHVLDYFDVFGLHKTRGSGGTQEAD